MKPVLRNPYVIAILGAALTVICHAQSTLLIDTFTVTGTPDTNDINYNNSVRQTGTQSTQTWTKVGPNFWQAQVGNNGVFGGDGNYLMVADAGGGARLAGLALSSALVAATEKLVVAFDADATGEWMSFMISPSSGAGLWHPVVGSGDFGLLIRPDGRIQAFNNNGVIPGINDVFLASAGVNTITLTFTGADGTGSPFAGNGTRVGISDGTNTWNATLDTGFTSETISFGSYANGGRGMVDNLSITTVPSFSPGRWSGETNGTWDDDTVNFSGKSFSQVKSEGATTATFADIDGSGNPVSQNNVTTAVGGVEIENVVFINHLVNYTLNSADSTGIKGATNLAKSGPGQVTVSGANTYTGTTTISSGGIVLAGGNNRLPVTTALTVTSPGVLRLGGNHQEVASLASNGRVVNGNEIPATFTVNNSAATTFSGNLGGAGADEDNLALVKSGSGTLNLTAASSYTGGTTINSGTVSLNYEPAGISNTPIGPMNSANTVTINHGGILTSDGSRNNWLSNTNVSSGGSNAISVIVNQGGTLRGAGNRITGLGNVTLNGGTIEVSNGLNGFGWFAAYNLGGDITVSGSTPSFITTSAGAGATANLQLADGSNTPSGGGTRFLTVNNVTNDAASDLVVGARISNGTLVKDGMGTVEIAAGETGTGFPVTWEVKAGTFLVSEGATFEFRVTDSTSNRVLNTGAGSAAFNGTLVIGSSAVSGATGMIWSLIDVAGLGATFGESFSVSGFDGPNNDGVWTKTDLIGDWSFSEQTGELMLDVGSDYETWKDDNQVVGDLADDDDSDGVTNFAEYAFGLDPRSGSSVSPIAVALDRTNGTFSYTRRASDLTELAYTVWFSSNLSDWTKDTGAFESPPVQDGEVETVEVTLSGLAGDPLPGRLFVQVRAE